MSFLLHLEKCLSTNDAILDYINQDEPIAVFTLNQQKGRGQYGNIWENFPNQNLAYSFAIRTSEIKISNILLNYYTAIIIQRFLANMTKAHVEIKWPNDIIMNGKKICGFLIEKMKIDGVYYFIIGVGINILQTTFEGLPKAGSILSITGKTMDLQSFVESFHLCIDSEINAEISENEILDNYNAHLFRKNTISVFQKNNARQNGIIRNADNQGFLWIDLEIDGLQKFFHKEIEMLY